MKISETKLQHIITESIEKVISENMLKKRIRQIVKESIESIGGHSFFEESEKESKEKEDKRLSDMSTENGEQSEVRDSIEKYFKQPEVNNAPYAYKLYGVESEKGKDTNDMKNARKKFADCVNHERNENGYPYSFNSSELNKLKGMITGNQLNESIRKALNKTLKKYL